MYSNKENINILTSLLVAHGIRKAVVCPGSRNAPIVHNLNEHPRIECYPVTDERSAGFYALGMSLADDSPVAVCVTSGSALLNLAPAVAEASYRHHGLIVISADRPSAWIEQLDGQTLPQPDALGCFVSKSVNLPEPKSDEERWYCNRLINEALIESKRHGCKSVHINVPISEPLFNFTVEQLPVERKISFVNASVNIEGLYRNIIHDLLEASKPLIVIGQISRNDETTEQAIRAIKERFTVICEPLASRHATPFTKALKLIDNAEAYYPDFILYLGDTLVSKHIKHFLRKANDAECWAVSEDGCVHDTFMNLTGVIEDNPTDVIHAVAEAIANDNSADDIDAAQLLTASSFAYREMWNRLFSSAAAITDEFTPAYSQMAAVKEFEMSLEDMDYDYDVHYANSMSVRLADIYSWHYIWCNRGVNGIEGSLSTAAGFSVATENMVFCVIGDLSFFYDQNALWNTNLSGNLRILLLNNGCGGIFYSLPGLENSSACSKMVAASHNTDAKGICNQNDIGYISARNIDELRVGMATFLTEKTKRPMVFEVFTNPDDDARVMAEYTKSRL